ncbi:MAG: IS30 family transposase [Alphaproteobacteria bacterium]|nr:IS30 family transposase [Alphaproteobacteria bacterium]
MSKYLTYDQRLEIEAGLKKGLSFGVIGKIISKDRTTVAKEIKRNHIIKKIGYASYPYNACVHRVDCRRTLVCNECLYPKKSICSRCKLCNLDCSFFIEDVCISKFKTPYVCNGCVDYFKCSLAKPYYCASDAHKIFTENVSESRSGLLTNEAEIKRINDIISPLIKKGQSVHQVYVHNKDQIMCSEKTLYNYIDACVFDVRNIDLPRKVKFRPRYKKPKFKIDRKCRINRKYEDYLAHMERFPEHNIVQMDSVIGRKGGKMLLTLHFVSSSFMLAFIRDLNTSQSVIDIFNYLYSVLGKTDYERLFQVILTDNGSEFSNPNAIEREPKNNLLRSHLFYCDPSSPHQKGAIEVNHTLLRRILHKGQSFDNLTQDDIILVMNHVNSYSRKKLNDRSPYETFSFYYGEDILRKLGYGPVAAESIIMKPNLLKRK